MAKRKTAPAKKQSDSVYLLKLVLYMIIGSLWLKITTGNGMQLPIPVGFVAGIIFASHEHFQLDRKIEYAVLLLAMLLGFWLPVGVYVSL